LVAHPGRHELEHLTLTSAEVGKIRGGAQHLLVVPEERAELGQKHFPGRLVLLKDVVIAFERHEASTRDERGYEPPLFVRDGSILARVQDEGWLGYAPCRVAHVDLGERGPDSRCHLTAG